MRFLRITNYRFPLSMNNSEKCHCISKKTIYVIANYLINLLGFIQGNMITLHSSKLLRNLSIVKMALGKIRSRQSYVNFRSSWSNCVVYTAQLTFGTVLIKDANKSARTYFIKKQVFIHLVIFKIFDILYMDI